MHHSGAEELSLHLSTQPIGEKKKRNQNKNSACINKDKLVGQKNKKNKDNTNRNKRSRYHKRTT
jgi:hypothetical protein